MPLPQWPLWLLGLNVSFIASPFAPIGFSVEATTILTQGVAERVEKINARNIASINLSVFNEEMKTASAISLPKSKVLVHGDLYCRHLMFYRQELVGIIDWGDVGINNPAVDLGVVFSFYPADCHQDFFDIYGDIDSQTCAYARFLGLYSAITIMLYGHDIEDPQLVQEAKESILRINSKLLEQSS